MGKPVAFEASAEERETRGFISMTIMRPLAGSMANCTFEPPVSTPISRSTARLASRMRCYSLSVSGRAGGDRVAGMNAHRIDVLDGADDDAIVRLVADDLHLEFLPAEDAFLDQDFGGRRGVEAVGNDLDELVFVIGNAAAEAAHGEAGADDGRQA